VGRLLGEPLNAPSGGMFGFCLLSTLAIVYAKRRSKLPPDTLIGVFLALSLGLGLCLLVAGPQPAPHVAPWPSQSD
jgi:zinc transport system permease protein